VAAVYDGATRTEVARIGGVTSQIVRDWMVKFNAHGPDGLIDRKAPGQPSRLNDTHLAEMATAVAPSAHAVLLVDQAGWHLSDRLLVPPNISLLPLPAKCPELNPVENIWQFIRDNWLSNRVFRSERDIVDHCCNAWNKLVAQPWRIISIGLRDWAHRFRSPGVGIKSAMQSLYFAGSRVASTELALAEYIHTRSLRWPGLMRFDPASFTDAAPNGRSARRCCCAGVGARASQSVSKLSPNSRRQ
jgi:transposase